MHIFCILFTAIPLRCCLYENWDWKAGGMGQKERSESVCNFFMNLIWHLYNAGTFLISFQASKISLVSDAIDSQGKIFHVKCFSFFHPTTPPRFPRPSRTARWSLLVHDPSNQSLAPDTYKKLNQIKFPVVKSINIGHENGLWVFIENLMANHAQYLLSHISI